MVLAGTAVWHFGLARRWTQRLPPGWSASTRYVGTLGYPDTLTGQLPERDEVSEYDRTQRVMPDSGRRPVVLEDRLVIRSIATGNITWEYATRDVVDPRTGAHLAERYRGEVAVLPRGVRRMVYRLRTNYVKGVPLTFDRADTLDELVTWVFGYRGRGEYTESYRGWGEFPGVQVPPGHEIRCADDQFYYRIWVEPVTGEQVKIEEGCPSGDYFYDVETGARAGAVDRWSGVTAGDALIERIAVVRRLRARYLWASRYLPATGLLFGLALLGFGISRRAGAG